MLYVIWGGMEKTEVEYTSKMSFYLDDRMYRLPRDLGKRGQPGTG